MSEDATLADVTVEPHPSTSGAKEQADAAKAAADATAKATADAAASADKDATDIGRLILESGYSREQVNDILQAPNALASLRQIITENPQELINLLDRTSPDAAKKLLDTAADVYVKRYGKEDAPAAAKSDSKTDPSLMAEVASLRETVQGFQNEKAAAQNAAAMAAVKSRYDARVDDLFGQLPKDMGLTKAETKALRARIDAELASDATVVTRVSRGNFVDVPHKFKAVIDEWANDRKAAVQAEKDRRDGVDRNASAEFLGGPNPFLPADTSFTESWDATEDAFSKALTRAAR